ncbi:hypothetical protein [Halobacterium wangiae]|uniref:hypothetical protein n=1 Tax=Halobacterium wangiae TaxID=2902623 RepID=UPI001E5B24B4|nr:hypothetical protein [Halobacterium wangiae]
MNNTQGTENTSNGTERTYKLDCTACSFETVVEGDLDDAYDLIEEHEEKYETTKRNHFVDLVTKEYDA